MKINLLILNAGANLRKAYYTDSDAAYFELPIRELSWRDLRKYDLIVIPAWSDQDLLFEHSKQLTQFVECGGVILQFGCHSVKWFKFIDWTNDANKEAKQTEIGTQLFLNIDFKYLLWHSEFLAHGYLRAKTQNAKVLAEDGSGHPIALSIEHGKGVAYFTTLDPDFHFITGSFVQEDNDKRIDQALILLRNSIQMALQEFASRHSWFSRYKRRLQGVISFLNMAPTLIILSFLIILVTITITVLESDPSVRNSPATIWSLIATVAGLAVAIPQLVRELIIMGRRR